MSTVTTFEEFLTKLHGQEKTPEVLARRREWVEAVASLLTDIKRWLRELDPNGLMEVSPQTVERHEPGLGTYDAPGLVIEVGKVRVEVLPGGRNSRIVPPPGKTLLGPVLGVTEAAGRVDVTNRTRRISLYRLVKPGNLSAAPTWATLDVGADGIRFVPLDRGLFERMLRELLS